MNPLLFLSCLGFAISLGIGQLMFKLAAADIKMRLNESYLSAVCSPWLLGALALYAASTLLWVIILMQMTLSRAYPFALLGAAIVPILAVLILGESISPYYPIGMFLVVLGVAIIQVS